MDFFAIKASEKLTIKGSTAEVDNDDPPVMFYDTLLKDGTYRLGKREIREKELPVWHLEGDEARNALNEIRSLDLR